MSKWVDIPGYEGAYQICRSGRVRSLSRRVGGKAGSMRSIPGKILTNFVDDGYWCVALGDSNNGKGGKRRLHILLARTFIPNPKNKPEVNHINGIKLDVRLSNLEWNTRQENASHAQRMGLLTGRSEANRGVKLTMAKVRVIKRKLARQVNKRKLAKQFGVGYCTIVDIGLGRTWADVA